MDIDATDTLKKFGGGFQVKCIVSLLTDKLFLEQIFDILSAEHFESEANRWIVDTVREYFSQYKCAPTLNVFKVKIDPIDNEVLKKSIVEQLRNVYAHINDTDIKFVKEQFLEFCRNQKWKKAIWDSTDYLKLGQYDNIKKVIDEAMKAGMERNLGHEYFQDVEKRMSEMARCYVKTNWPVIDQLLDGGLAKGELGFVVAPAGSGKSWLLAKLGSEAMKNGKNVVHFTLELNENYVGLRYDSCFTGIDFQDIRKNVDVVKKKIEEIPGRLFIKYFPIKTIASHTIKMHVERIEMLTGTKVDLIVVDYADLLRPAMADKNANSYSEAGNVYEELRAVAGELQVPIWSASQSHRCLTLDTQVITKRSNLEGMIENVVNIKVGDLLLTHDGYRKVSNIFPTQNQPVYKIKLKSGKEIKCSINHEFPVKYGMLKSISTGLEVGDKLFTIK